MARRRSAVLAGAALALAVLGCGRAANTGNGGNDIACTLIGCGSSVVVTVDEPGERPLEACVAEACSLPGESAASRRLLMIEDVRLGDSVEVVVRVAGGGSVVAQVTATPRTSQPNGPGCSPACRAVRLRLTVQDRLVPA